MTKLTDRELEAIAIALRLAGNLTDEASRVVAQQALTELGLVAK